MSPLSIVLGATGAPSTALPEHPGLLENLEFQAVGLVIVMGALFLIYLVCAAIGAGFQYAERVQARPVAEPEQAPAPSPTESAELPLVAIAAAVAAVVDQPHRVVKVAPASVGWSREGRRQLLTSHQLRK